jgi:peptidoglycan/LPS O-acetylase OafA/YrhL
MGKVVVSPIDLIAALFFLPSPASHYLFPLNVAAWSLFFELIANSAFGLIGRQLSNVILAVMVAVSGAILILAVATGAFGFGSAGIGAMADGFTWGSFGAGLLRVLYSFFAGVLVYRIWRLRQPSRNVPAVLLVAILGAILASHPSEHYQACFDLMVAVVIFPLLVWIGASSVVGNSMARLFTWLGAASYGVYVLQIPLYGLTVRILGKMQGNVDYFGWPWSVAFIGFVFLIAPLLTDISIARSGIC